MFENVAESAADPSLRRTTVIVGASSGVGRALAEAVARSRSNVVLVSRDKRDLECLARHVSLSFGITACVESLDLAAAELNSEAVVRRWRRASRPALTLSLVPAGCVEELELTLPAERVIETTVRRQLS